MENRRFHLSGSVVPLFVLCAAVCSAAVYAAPQDWPTVTEEEKAIKDCPGQPGAAAVYLLRVQISNDNDRTFRVFHRLKILTPAGKEYGNVEVPFSEAWQVKEIKARVVRPDGQSRPFTGEIFEKTIVQIGRLERLVKIFALPDIDVGSIIDYRYELKLDLKKAASGRSLQLERWKPEEGGIPNDLSLLSYTVERWDFDSPLYTYKAKYIYIPFRSGQITFGDTTLRLAWVSYGLTWGGPLWKEGSVELEVDAIPAREEAELMAPEEEGRMGVIFFFCDSTVSNATAYWRREAASWRDWTEEFLKEAGGADKEVLALVSPGGADIENLKALYDRAQRIRNLSYDKTMTPSRRKEMKIKDNRNVADVLKRNAGLRSDITRTFVALARAAGFSADVARVVSRDDKFFHENVLGLYGQFDTEVAVVKVGGREMFFDPATPFCPMGLVPWNCSDTTFIRTSGLPGKFFTTPLDPPDKSSIHREFALQLDAQGRMTGTVKMTFTGQEALIRRLDYLDVDETEVKKLLEEKMTALMSGEAMVSLRKVDNMANSEDAVRLEFDVSLPASATVVGDRMVLPVMPFRAGWHDSFRHSGRRASVYFPYLCRESDDIVLTLPAGMKVEAAPAACQNKRSFAEHSLAAVAEEGGKLHVQRELVIGKIRIPADQYSILKIFFDQVRAGDEGQVVLALDKK